MTNSIFLPPPTVSDDNSSIQSSPWQRDHHWKQTSPKKCVSHELNFQYLRPVPVVLSKDSQAISKCMRRQPHTKKFHDKCIQYAKRIEAKTNAIDAKSVDDSQILTDGNANAADTKSEAMDSDVVDGKVNGNGITADAMPDADEKMDVEPTEYKNGAASTPERIDPDTDENSKKSTNDETPPEQQNEEATKTAANECNGITTIESLRRKRLFRSTKMAGVIERLIVRASEQPQTVTSTQIGLGFPFSQTSRSADLMHTHQHVSPRKRFLREFEKVSLEDRQANNTQKRSRSKCSSNDYTATNNSHAKSSSTFTFGKMENGRQSPHKRSHIADTSGGEQNVKHAKSLDVSPPQVAPSKPISNYSIISLLGHNSSNNTSDNSKYENNHSDDKVTTNDLHQSPRSPTSYNHQSASRSAFVAKKRSPTNCGSNSLIGSPVNYRNARSPDINSPSPGLQSSSLHRYHSNLSSAASLSSPTSRYVFYDRFFFKRCQIF